jgi:hypothetical protein
MNRQTQRDNLIMMQVHENAVAYYLQSLRAGDVEPAFFGLLDLGHEVLPLLIAEARKPEATAIRADLVRIIWQYRRPETINFLGERLSDADPSVWKEALDGLVAIGGTEARGWISSTLERVNQGVLRNGLTADWLIEALEQTQ